MRKLIPAVFCCLVVAAVGCEQNDLGRYCVVGQPVPQFNENIFGQPSVTVLNLEAPECNKRLCLQQGPFKLHPEATNCQDALCQPPYGCDSANRCVYNVKSMCTKECKKHSDCKAGSQEANGEVCSEYVCHKQAKGEAFEDHCICVCKDFLLDPEAENPKFYDPGDIVPPPQNCK